MAVNPTARLLYHSAASIVLVLCLIVNPNFALAQQKKNKKQSTHQSSKTSKPSKSKPKPKKDPGHKLIKKQDKAKGKKTSKSDSKPKRSKSTKNQQDLAKINSSNSKHPEKNTATPSLTNSSSSKIANHSSSSSSSSPSASEPQITSATKKPLVAPENNSLQTKAPEAAQEPKPGIWTRLKDAIVYGPEGKDKKTAELPPVTVMAKPLTPEQEQKRQSMIRETMARVIYNPDITLTPEEIKIINSAQKRADREARLAAEREALLASEKAKQDSLNRQKKAAFELVLEQRKDSLSKEQQAAVRQLEASLRKAGISSNWTQSDSLTLFSELKKQGLSDRQIADSVSQIKVQKIDSFVTDSVSKLRNTQKRQYESLLIQNNVDREQFDRNARSSDSMFERNAENIRNLTTRSAILDMASDDDHTIKDYMEILSLAGSVAEIGLGASMVVLGNPIGGTLFIIKGVGDSWTAGRNVKMIFFTPPKDGLPYATPAESICGEAARFISKRSTPNNASKQDLSAGIGDEVCFAADLLTIKALSNPKTYSDVGRLSNYLVRSNFARLPYAMAPHMGLAVVGPVTDRMQKPDTTNKPRFAQADGTAVRPKSHQQPNRVVLP